MIMTNVKKHKVVIVGAGFGGMCIAIKLKQAGINDFIIIDKANELGGTWRDNTYPGAECDIPSALYSYSFEPNHQWEFKWSGQRQILRYQNDTADKYGLGPHFCFGQKVLSANYKEETSHWLITTQQGQVFQAQHYISAVGQLHYPNIPSLEGVESFHGETFHSAKWNHGIELKGKRVGVIGNAASAVQFIPEIARVAEKVTVYQRSANWVLPKLDRPYAKWEQKLSSRFPFVTRAYRWFVWAVGEYGVLSAIKGNKFARWMFEKISLRHLNHIIKKPEIVAALTPSYAIGAKRILFSDHYYLALARDNVELVTEPINQLTEQGIDRGNNQVDALDVIIYGTGFKTNPFIPEVNITGINNANLHHDVWRGGAHAYLGVATHGFPNFHMIFGPNTNLGHSSVIIMHEAQAEYIVQHISYLDAHGFVACEVSKNVELDYNNDLQKKLRKLAFNGVDQSWYMDSGKITTNWAGGTRQYQRLLKQVDHAAYSYR